MKRNEMRKTIQKNPVLAILRNVPEEELLPYAKAIMDGGVKFFEVALNSDGALRQICSLKEKFGDEILVGAGTATTVERAKEAVMAGAEFLLSPSADEPVLEYCRREEIAILPGALTPSEVNLCISYGCREIKLFPAGEMPLSYVKSLKGPLDDTEYMAIGGVSANNAAEFLKAGYLGVGMAGALVPREIRKTRNWEAARDSVRSMMDAVWKTR